MWKVHQSVIFTFLNRLNLRSRLKKAYNQTANQLVIIKLTKKYDMNEEVHIGFIGQGWIGKNYADNFEERGFAVTRYSQEEPYINNKEKIAECDIVFIAVPTPTTPDGFDDSIVRTVLPLVGKGKIAVIKSTVLPGRTELLQNAFPDVFVFHSPEFLSEATARHDADYPDRNIVGIVHDTSEYHEAAERVISILPQAPFDLICSSREAEMIKYLHNVNAYIEIMFNNMAYDVSEELGCDWGVLKKAVMADPMVSHTYLNPVHKGGRGAGGHCFIKDFAAFRGLCEEVLPREEKYHRILRAAEEKNNELLRNSAKSLDILEGVYGKDVLEATEPSFLPQRPRWRNRFSFGFLRLMRW